ncbi:hypothetical protein [Methylobacterium trifolii]|uniref:hypothetical protein n=1 Tax=Methylobacterium trifolii TaxID=1003092 RepID=UPI001EDEE9EF|nr:hypothetical protein [Methylobacterium trifolii]
MPRQLVQALRDRGIDASRFQGHWTSKTNGELIRAVEADGFAVLVTNDKNIADQQSLRGRNIAVVALPHNRRRPIVERVDDIADTIRRAEPGQHVVMGLDGSRMVVRATATGPVTQAMPAVPPFDLP